MTFAVNALEYIERRAEFGAHLLLRNHLRDIYIGKEGKGTGDGEGGGCKRHK